MATQHRLAGSSKNHSGNNPKYMQSDTGPKQALQKAMKNISGTSPAKNPGSTRVRP